MSSNLEDSVQATGLVLLPIAGPGREAVPPKGTLEREDIERAQRAVADSTLRWKVISEAGGIDAWIKAELTTKGLSTEGLTPGAAQYKEKKKAEAQERRNLRRLAWQAYHATHITHLGAGIHWDDTTRPKDKLDIEQREARAKANGLPDIADANGLAAALGVTISRLRWWAFQRDVDTGTHYRIWSIPKRDGTSRTITAPKKALKQAQRWALRAYWEKLPVHAAAHGFLANRSIVTNAAEHAGAHTIVKIDIKDFFPTVNWRRVRGLLRKGGAPESVATILALLSTASPRREAEFRGQRMFIASGPRVLPQGAPTSPAITNAICLRMDRRLSGLAKRLGFHYTRYADDLTFSWRAPATSPDPKKPPHAPVGTLLRASRQILSAEGFHVHVKKTSVMRGGMRQRVTGLIVNAAKDAPPARVPRDVVRRLRAAIHNREKGKTTDATTESLAQLKGMAAFVHMADAVKGRAFLDRIAALEAREAAATTAQ
jgi:hypothetical protein